MAEWIHQARELRHVRRSLVPVFFTSLIVCALMAFATWAFALDRLALWQVVRACVADAKLTGAPFPCLKVDLTGGEARGYVVLRPPFLEADTIVAPTRKIAGIEDPFLQSPAAPNYFEDAWRARSFLRGPDGAPPDRNQVALIVNSAVVRTEDQLHIHVGCLASGPREAISAFAPGLPVGEWKQVGAVTPHQNYWGLRIRGADLASVDPFRLVAEALADKTQDRAAMMIVVAALRVADDDEFVILTSYVGAPHSWWPPGADEFLDPSCSSAPNVSGLK